MYEIRQQFINFNRSFEALYPEGGVNHETANPGDTDEGETNYFNTGYRGASAHAFIDSDSITQNIPWGEQAWGAGPTANQKFWHIEMCHTSDPVKFKEIWKRAVWLWAYLFTNQMDTAITKVTEQNLLSHAQVSDMWKETDHTDPLGYFATFGVTMADLRNAIQKCINTGEIDDLKIGGNIVMIIKNGDNGAEVLSLQKKLNVLGYGLVEDGDFGPATEKAVRNFQSSNSLVIDGVVGQDTILVLDDTVKKTQESAEESKIDYKQALMDIQAIFIKYGI